MLRKDFATNTHKYRYSPLIFRKPDLHKVSEDVLQSSFTGELGESRVKEGEGHRTQLSIEDGRGRGRGGGGVWGGRVAMVKVKQLYWRA